jgi:hypothetical protein
VGDGLDALQRSRSRQREFRDEPPRSPEMLAEHALNIWLVIDDKNVGTQVVPPAVF